MDLNFINYYCFSLFIKNIPQKYIQGVWRVYFVATENLDFQTKITLNM